METMKTYNKKRSRAYRIMRGLTLSLGAFAIVLNMGSLIFNIGKGNLLQAFSTGVMVWCLLVVLYSFWTSDNWRDKYYKSYDELHSWFLETRTEYLKLRAKYISRSGLLRDICERFNITSTHDEYESFIQEADLETLIKKILEHKEVTSEVQPENV